MVDNEPEQIEITERKIELTGQVPKTIGRWLDNKLRHHIKAIKHQLDSRSLQTETSNSLLEVIHEAKSEPDKVKEIIEGFKSAKVAIITPRAGGGGIDFIGKNHASLKPGEVTIANDQATDSLGAIDDAVRNPTAKIYACAELIWVRSKVKAAKKAAKAIMLSSRSMETVLDQISGSDKVRFRVTPKGNVEVAMTSMLLSLEMSHALGGWLSQTTSDAIRKIEVEFENARSLQFETKPHLKGVIDKIPVGINGIKTLISRLKTASETRMIIDGRIGRFEFSESNVDDQPHPGQTTMNELTTKILLYVLRFELGHLLSNILTGSQAVSLYSEQKDTKREARRIQSVALELKDKLDKIKNAQTLGFVTNEEGIITMESTPFSPSSSLFQKT